MELLILCNENDPVAYSLFHHLKKNNKSVCLVTADELTYADSWLHEINPGGKPTTEIKLQNGKIIHSGKLKAAFNRIRFFSMLHFRNEMDRYYAQNEMSALFFSFLNSINSVLINPINIHDLAMEGENILYLKKQAIKAGLKVLDYHFTSSPKWKTSKNLIPFSPGKKTEAAVRKKAPYLLWQNEPAILIEPSTRIVKHWAVGGKTIGGETIHEAKALKKLSSNLNKIFLEVDFAKTSDGLKLSNVNPFPATAPDEAIEALAKLLLEKAKQEV